MIPVVASTKTRWVLITIAILLVASLWIGAIVYVFVSAGGESFAGGEFDETVVEDGEGRKIAMIEITGVITSEAAAPGIANDDAFRDQIKQALEDDDVAAIILDIDSPGGEVVASDNMYRAVKEARSEKPVVALMGATAASGGYYVAAAANEIVANSETITGSIGVIFSLLNLEGAAGKLGIQEVVIKSGPYKDIASPFREMSPEELAILQRLIDQTYGRFVDVVSEGRKLDEAKVREIADGRVYSGSQAKDLGLVDRLGGQPEAFELAKKLGKAPEAALVRYETSFGFADILNPLGQFADRVGVNKPAAFELRPGLKYLWMI